MLSRTPAKGNWRNFIDPSEPHENRRPDESRCSWKERIEYAAKRKVCANNILDWRHSLDPSSGRKRNGNVQLETHRLNAVLPGSKSILTLLIIIVILLGRRTNLDIAVSRSRGEEILVRVECHALDCNRRFMGCELMAKGSLSQIPQAHYPFPTGRYQKLVLGCVQ